MYMCKNKGVQCEYANYFSDCVSTACLKESREAISSNFVPYSANSSVGWICPVCGSVNAPWVTKCFCSIDNNSQ